MASNPRHQDDPPLISAVDGYEWPVPASMLLASTVSGWLLVDSNSLVVAVNRQVESLFGYKGAEIVGSSVDLLVAERQRASLDVHRAARSMMGGGRAVNFGLNLVGLHKDGREFPADVALSPINYEDRAYTLVIVRDVTERRNLEEERNLLALELEMEMERQRIGMDLHDGIMQEIYGAGLTLELALEDLEHDTEGSRERISRAIDQLHDVIRNIRSYIFDLRPRQFTGHLEEALTDLAREFGQNSLIQTAAQIQPNLPVLPSDRAIALYHIAHESLSNIHKHAHARNVTLRLGAEDDRMVLEVEDDGRGFDTATDLPQQHRGMRNMSVRARSIGGFLDVHSQPGRGTTIRVELPLEAAEA